MKLDTDKTAFIGCAGWSIPKAHASGFPDVGSHLERYATRFTAVEINSSFYRPHRPATYAKWAVAVPDSFRFAVKVPKTITHEKRLVDVHQPLRAFLAEVAALDNKLGPLLVQLPPSLAYSDTVEAFFDTLRGFFNGYVACEPRHASWFAPEADALLAKFHIGRVAADPAVVPQAAEPGGWKGLLYYRLHGSPTIYRSAYSSDFLARLTADIRVATARAAEPTAATWCIFDNTANGEATGNALDLIARIRHIAE
jgi:uncharacterized protein YecE (DUF72 family)